MTKHGKIKPETLNALADSGARIAGADETLNPKPQTLIPKQEQVKP